MKRPSSRASRARKGGRKEKMTINRKMDRLSNGAPLEGLNDQVRGKQSWRKSIYMFTKN